MEGDDEQASAVPDIESEQIVRRLDNEWVAAFLRRDIQALGLIMASDFVFIYPFDGDGKDRFIADVTSGDLVVESLVRDNLEVRIYENTAVGSGIDNSKWRYKGRDILGYYRILNVYSRRRGEWQLVAIQACPIDLD